ncbi:inactive serine protease 54 [Vombatus ursinus]|uniref:inactive serine protease 54 n=1 Tax=Vombatus ursinus TaxID=29139 RepID=UPI000FFD2466|nr:inactive serine protease 54 [Vombatus ursinus]
MAAAAPITPGQREKTQRARRRTGPERRHSRPSKLPLLVSAQAGAIDRPLGTIDSPRPKQSARRGALGPVAPMGPRALLRYLSPSCLVQSSFISAFLPNNDDDDLATVDTFPWVVSLQDSWYTHLTFGCILNEFWILSIASCFQNRKKVLALVGITDMNARRRTQPEHPISAILRHKGFNDMTLENNLALLKTYTAIEFNDQVQPICLPGRRPAPGILENCWVSGWIHIVATRKKMEMDVPRKLSLQEVWPCSLKRPWGTAHYRSREENNAFGCLGDLGNPAMFQAKESSLWVLRGILNKGGMSRIGPFLYAKLSYHSDWISKRIMKDHIDLCPIFRWQSTPFPAVRSKLQNITLVKPLQAFSFPPPPQEDLSKMQKGQARLKSAPVKTATSSQGMQASGSPEMEYQENGVGRAGSVGLEEPIYYDYYNGEVMLISGQDRLCQTQGMVSAFCLLALRFGGI